MAVDVRTLRIGSHVLYKGQRVEVWEIYNGDKVQAIAYPSIVDDVVWKFEPIAITPELLAELGFEYTSHDFGMWWQKKIGNRLCEIDECNDKWVIVYKGCDCAIRYLHEAEALLALHGVELIKE